MKIALVSETEDSAVDQVFQDLKRGLSLVRPDWEVVQLRCRTECPDTDLDFSSFDLVHAGGPSYNFLNRIEIEVPCPLTVNVWHITPAWYVAMGQALALRSYSRIVVDDLMTLQLLGQLNWTRVTPIPMAFDPERWPKLPIPPEPFTVGAFGDSHVAKRLNIIQQGCSDIGMKSYLLVPPRNRKVSVLEPVEDIYSRIHVFAHASFVDTNCRPVLEALACGIPVVSVVNDGMRRVSNGGNVTFYDGSPQDLGVKLQEIQEKYTWHREAALYTSFPSLEMVALKYAKVFEDAIEEIE